jgi:hypothetical protein
LELFPALFGMPIWVIIKPTVPLEKRCQMLALPEIHGQAVFPALMLRALLATKSV